jgi:hypothetical protein
MLDGSLFSIISFRISALGTYIRAERKVEEKDRVNWIAELMKRCSLPNTSPES